MKKILAMLLAIAMITMLWIPSFADEEIVTHHLTSDGNNSITVKNGDIIEVNYSVTSNGSVSIMTMQDEIFYDSSFLEIVEDSNKDLTKGRYNTSVQVNSKGEHFVYFNTMSTQNINSDGIAVGTIQFKVIGKKGSTVIKNTSYKGYNSSGNKLNSAAEDLTVTIEGTDESGGGSSSGGGGGGTVEPEPITHTDVTTDTDVAEFEMKFVDVTSTDYFYEAVKWAASQGITSGIDEEHFAPFAVTTRAQMVTFLWRAAGKPEPVSSTCIFEDVIPGSYYEKAVIWAVENNITKGISDTKFGPDVNVTRAQTVTFMARMAGVSDNAAGNANSFSDVYSNDYYFNAVSWAVENNITKGTSEATFGPGEDCLRGQIVTFLYRYFVK